MTLPLLKMAIVGHTNAGKTSLLRTLLRDVNFGEISASPGTTTEVTGCKLLVDGIKAVQLYDTPGLEDSISLLEHLESKRTSHQTDGHKLVKDFLSSEDAAGRFNQEAKALREVLKVDVALYVVDARERMLAKYRDELRILGYCAKPIVPVLNFTASETAITAEWREQLAKVNMHAVAEFDTVVLESEGERRLFEKIRSLLDSHRNTIDALVKDRQHERASIIRSSAHTIANMLLDAASYSIVTEAENKSQTDEAIDKLKNDIREREQQCVAALLDLHRFKNDDYTARDLPLDDGSWGEDLFSPEAIKDYGIKGGGGAVAGAMVGLTVDVMFGGISLGAATVIGAAVGALVGASGTLGKELLRKFQGKKCLRCDDSTLQILAAREIELVRALLHRGHADIKPVQPRTGANQQLANEAQEIAKLFSKARNRPTWCRINPDHNKETVIMDVARDRLLENTATRLTEILTD